MSKSPLDPKRITEKLEQWEKPLQKFFEVVTGRKDIKHKVDVLANPENPKSMSVLSEPATEFCATAYFCAGVEEWGGIFDGLKDFANEHMNFSPSKKGLGREQVISFVGAIEESKKKEGVNLTVSQRSGAEAEKEKE